MVDVTERSRAAGLSAQRLADSRKPQPSRHGAVAGNRPDTVKFTGDRIVDADDFWRRLGM